MGTITTYTGNTVQTGDAYAIVHNGTFGNSAIETLVAAIPTNPYTGTPPTAAAIATAVWTDTTSSDFTTTSSPGKILVTQLGGAFTTTSSSVFTVAALANVPDWRHAPTAAQIATAVWEDTTAGGDFGTAGSIGKLIVTTGLTIAGVTGVTFPATVASPTNITAGTITTVTNLTNAPTAGDFTATMKTSLGTAVGTAQTGDAYAIVHNGTFGNSALQTLIAAIPTNPYTGTPPTTSQIATAVLTTAMTESYAADGAAPTLAQIVFQIYGSIMEQVFPGSVSTTTTITLNKLDGATGWGTVTVGLDSNGLPITRTRAS